jgi:hypothetical protein
MRKLVRENGLSIAMLCAFLIFFTAQSLTGYRAYNLDQEEHGESTAGFGEYLTSGHFIEATFENWESEFFQMSAYVFLTVFLYQRGSVESKNPDEKEPTDEDPRLHAKDPDAPWPVRRGGFVLLLYKYSLTLAFVLLFLISFALHAWGGAQEYSEEQIAHGGESVTTLHFVRTSAFWFQSFQNWQSEFLAVGSIVILSIFLRQQGSPESKPVAAPHSATGG